MGIASSVSCRASSTFCGHLLPEGVLSLLHTPSPRRLLGSSWPAVNSWSRAVPKAWGLPAIPGVGEGLLKSEITCVASRCRRGTPPPRGRGAGRESSWPPAGAQLSVLPASLPPEPFSPEGTALWLISQDWALLGSALWGRPCCCDSALEIIV